jgi:uncharacterized OB-fold protein
MSETEKEEKRQLPIHKGLFHEPTSPGEKSYLIGSKCKSCGLVFFPQKLVCPYCCKDDTLEPIPLNGKGKLKRFVLLRTAGIGFKAPYFIGYVQLAEGPIVYSLITGAEPRDDALEEGMDMEVVIEKVKEDEKGNELIGYEFRPVK